MYETMYLCAWAKKSSCFQLCGYVFFRYNVLLVEERIVSTHKGTINKQQRRVDHITLIENHA